MTQQIIAIAERLVDAIEALEAGMVARDAEPEWPRHMADTASAAVADLDAFIAGAVIPANSEGA